MKVTLVAEIASNWEGNVTKAKKLIKESYQGIKKIEGIQKYSSDSVEKISVKDLKTIIENAGLLN